MAPFDNVDTNVMTGILAMKTLNTANMLPYGCDNSKNSNIWQQRLPLVTTASTATAQKYFLLAKQNNSSFNHKSHVTFSKQPGQFSISHVNSAQPRRFLNCLKIPASSLRVPYASPTYDATYAIQGSTVVESALGQTHPGVDLSSLTPKRRMGFINPL